jgi:hypothetical protein
LASLRIVIQGCWFIDFVLEGGDMGKSESNSKKSFWETAPGIITAFAALVTAIGAILGIPAIANRLFPPTPTPIVSSPPTDVPTPIDTQPTKAVIVETSTNIPSITLPKIYGFQTCVSLCNGQNSSKSFSEGIKKIYAQFNYENFPSGIKYVRTWSLNGMEWIRYSCNWDGPTSGTEVLTLKEPQGLRSGTWEITIIVDDKVVLKDQITVNGNWDYWDPAGTINACHGTVD